MRRRLCLLMLSLFVAGASGGGCRALGGVIGCDDDADCADDFAVPVDLRVIVINADQASDTATHGVARRCTAQGQTSPIHTDVGTVRCVVDDLWATNQGSGAEQPLAALVTALSTRAVDNGNPLRAGAALHAVLIGDSADQSDASVAQITAFLDGLVPDQTRSVTFHALAFADSNEQCPGNVVDARLDAVVTHTGGRSGSVCDTAQRTGFYADVLRDIAGAP